MNNPEKKKKKKKVTLKKKEKKKKESKYYKELTIGKRYTKKIKNMNIIVNKRKADFCSQSMKGLMIKKFNREKDKNLIIMDNDDMNELPYTRAIKIDKRSIFQIFYSIIIQKISLIDLFCGKYKVRIMVVSENILSFLFNFFLILYYIQMKSYHINIIIMDNWIY